MSKFSVALLVHRKWGYGCLDIAQVPSVQARSDHASIGALNWLGYRPRATIGSQRFAQMLIET
jgi:hypothetical protein